MSYQPTRPQHESAKLEGITLINSPDTELARMLAGEPYVSSDPGLVARREHARQLCHRLNHGLLDPADTRRLLEGLLGACGAGATIVPPFHCDYGFNIQLGDESFFNFNCVVLDVCHVTIGHHTLIAPGVHIYTATHPLDAPSRRTHESGRPVTIGNDVWIGGGAIICPGVTIGDGAVIGAGSVVTKDVPPRMLAVGNPCRVVRELPPSKPVA